MENNLSQKKRIIFPIILGLLCLLVLLLAWLASIIIRSGPAYEYLKQVHPGMGQHTGEIFIFDPIAGPVLKPNSTGAHLIKNGDPVPVQHNEQGLRIPLSHHYIHQETKKPRILFLGDSFTYGELVSAEDSFAFKAAADLGGHAINGGVPGYGLAQMLLQARKLIPTYKPDYVVVQYSPWLVLRAQSEFSQGSMNAISVPYFFDDGNKLNIAPTSFTPPRELILGMERFKNSPTSISDKIHCTLNIWIPFFLHRDFHVAKLRIRQIIGASPRPSRKSDDIVRYFYAEINALSKNHGATTIILALGMNEQLIIPGELFPEHIAGVNGWLALLEKINPKTQMEYARQYYLWRGNPAQPVDSHPNERAHNIISKAVAERIRQLESHKH